MWALALKSASFITKTARAGNGRISGETALTCLADSGEVEHGVRVVDQIQVELQQTE